MNGRGCVLVPQLPLLVVEAIYNGGLVKSSEATTSAALMMPRKPIFFDPSGRRGRVLSAFTWVSGTISLLTIAAFVLTLVIVDWPPQENRNNTAPQAYAVTTIKGPVDPQLLKSAHELAAELRESERTLALPHPRSAPNDRRSIEAKLPTGRPASIGFYVNDDDNSYPDLKRALPHLDWLIPSWMSLDGSGMELKTDIDKRALNYIRKTNPDMPILPMVQNAVDGRWDSADLGQDFSSTRPRAALASAR